MAARNEKRVWFLNTSATPAIARGYKWWLPALLAGVVCLATGCGPALYPVTGKVLDGETPVTTGSVTFVPDTEKGNTSTFSPRGEIGENGEYTLYTNESQGAPAGVYKVTVVAQGVPAGGDPYAAQEPLVNKKYMAVETSPLSIEVKSGAADGHYDLKLDKK